MAYTAGNLHLIGGSSVGNELYHYDYTTDTLDTIMTAGYFNNSDDNLNLAAGDLILINALDGNLLAEVASVSSGSVTLIKLTGDRQIISAVTLSSSIAIPIAGVDVLLATPTSVTTGMQFDSVPKKGQKLIVVNQGTTSSVTVAISAYTGSQMNVGANATATIKGKGGSVELIAVTSSVWMDMRNEVTPSTSPDVVYS